MDRVTTSIEGWTIQTLSVIILSENDDAGVGRGEVSVCGRQVHHLWGNKQLLFNNSSSHRDKVELELLLPPQREFQPQHGLFLQSL